MLISLLRAIFVRSLILSALILVSCTLPFVTFWLLKSESGIQIIFWASPWVVCFWSLIAFNLVGSKFWRGREVVEEWKARRGAFLWRAFKGTCWTLFCLFASYGAEFG